MTSINAKGLFDEINSYPNKHSLSPTEIGENCLKITETIYLKTV